MKIHDFLGAGASVVEELKQRSVSPPHRAPAVNLAENVFYFVAIEARHRPGWGPLVRDGEDFSTNIKGCRGLLAGETKEGMNGRQANISRAGGIAAMPLQVFQEGQCRARHKRHGFAVAALERWYAEGVDVQTRLPHLATYLGHVSPVSTHYYLHLTPKLRAAAGKRFQQQFGCVLAGGGIA
jgi:hypothetical protein